MNKAFLREPDDTGQRHCPRCGSLAEPVGEATLAAQLSPSTRGQLADAAYFCPFARCEVIYFDDYCRQIDAAQFGRGVWPKDPAAPLCSCFGLTADDIDADLAEGGVRRVRELIERARSAEARCQTAAPSGRSCVAEVQRYYFQRRGR